MDRNIFKIIWQGMIILLFVLLAFLFIILQAQKCQASEKDEVIWQLNYWKEVKNRAVIEAAYADKMIKELEKSLKSIQSLDINGPTELPEPEKND